MRGAARRPLRPGGHQARPEDTRGAATQGPGLRARRRPPVALSGSVAVATQKLTEAGLVKNRDPPPRQLQTPARTGNAQAGVCFVLFQKPPGLVRESGEKVARETVHFDFHHFSGFLA